MRNMKIQFEPSEKDAELFFELPQPASKSIPDWYKNMPLHMDNEKITGLNKESVAVSNLTLKGCSPFLDALTSGYMFTLASDLEFRNHRGKGVNVRWATNVNLLSSHGPDQAPNIPEPFGGNKDLLKWKPGWRVITPKGYSCIFTHPFNRHDLPFRTFTGIVDTDSYPLGVEFPFQLLNVINDDIFILEKGTPICQVIPFKRDAWTSEQIPFDERENQRNGFKLKSKIVRSYKNQFWHRKSYL
jgi:hypothetical protein